MNLLKFKIRFSEINNAYLLNDKWVNEIDENHFINKAESIKKLIIKQLKNGLHHEEYLQKLVDRIWKRLQVLQNYKAISPEIIKVYSEIKDPVIPHKETPYSKTDLYNEFMNSSNQVTNCRDDQFVYLNSISKHLNNYETKIDFEYGLLSYAIHKYDDAICHLHSYLFSLHSNARYIDFKNLELDEINNSLAKKSKACHFNLDKKSVAHLFRFLLEEDILVFDEENESNNNLYMKQFVEDHFTYRNTAKERIPIKTFNREYSEVSSVSSPEVIKHKAFIDQLIYLLQQRRNRLKD